VTEYDYTWKIMMLGDASVGKTSLTIRYISGFFLEDLKLTIGVDFYSKTTSFKGKKVKLQIWDFGGEERFRFLLHQYCKGANAAFFLYDITNRLSLDHLPDWTQIIREHAGDVPIMLVGSKVDLKQYRVVSREEGILAAKKYNLSAFVELSSKTGENVEEAFTLITETLFERYMEK
jgi:small GTP-binding protein